MTVREIRLFGDPVLKTVSEPIKTFDQKTQALIEDLLDTTKLPGRAGVAAPQIGVNLRAFSFNVDGQLGYIINPVLVEVSGDKVLLDEGCLSVPELWHKTPRYEHAKAKGVDLDGEPIELHGSGLMAQMLQHECDHLDGLVYLDRLEGEERKIAMKNLRATDWFMK
ncbi:peptide deformylase [Rhodoluna lacicola]|jgi:peptide deformylase|uniref:Peptide deformylase n=1 Tax=Rhodoluna lacicola TaxID=529884 RepID=A0A060JG57_9MICO|nr:peptide deformylase [Rhodoluna lacicola]AIC47680.1 peptide deformylase [Rhodoluna lacicola]